MIFFSKRCKEVSALDFCAERLQKKRSENINNLLKTEIYGKLA